MPAAKASAPAGARRVLIIDDEPSVLRVLGLLLERSGFAVASASNGREGLTLIAEKGFDVVLTDIIMPELSGVDFLKELRQHDLDVPVILMTAGATLDSALDAIEYGAQQYLLKPVEPEALVLAVGRAAALGELARMKRTALAAQSGKAIPYGDRATLEAVLTRTFATIHAEFQPVVSMKKKNILGYEALMRCDETLFSSYGALLGAAERVGWRTALSRTLYQRIAQDCSDMPEGTLLFVNIHPLDAQESLLTGSGASLEAIARNVAVLDVRERRGRTARRALAAAMPKLRGAGFRIAIDNVGTGTSGPRFSRAFRLSSRNSRPHCIRWNRQRPESPAHRARDVRDVRVAGTGALDCRRSGNRGGAGMHCFPRGPILPRAICSGRRQRGSSRRRFRHNKCRQLCTPRSLSSATKKTHFSRRASRILRHGEIRPRVAAMERAAKLDPELIPKYFELGMMGIQVPEKYGGGGGSLMMVTLAVEEISKVDAAAAIVVDVQNTLVAYPIVAYGTEEQRKQYLPRLCENTVGAYALSEAGSGSDAFGLATRAEKKGDKWILTGRKLWITNGAEAGLFIVFANADPSKGYKGITAFIVEKTFPGFSVGKKEDKLGIRASSTTELILDGVEVPACNVLGPVGTGYKIAMETLNEGRIGIGAQMIGNVPRAHYARPLLHVKERKQFESHSRIFRECSSSSRRWQRNSRRRA